jgi:hypothetical protein
MIRSDRSKIRPASALLLALSLTMTGAEARGLGGGFHGGGFGGTRVGRWGRPLGPVRPGPAYFGRSSRPGFVERYPHVHHHWRRRSWGYYGYGLGGLGFGLGGLFGAFADRYVDDDVDPPTVEVPVEAPIDTPETIEGAAEQSAVAACARRFKTYDPATQTYVGRDFVRRRCP